MGRMIPPRKESLLASSRSLGGPDPAGESRGASAGSTPEVIKAGALEEGPAVVAVAVCSSGDKVPEGVSSTTGCLQLSTIGDLR